MPRQLSCNGNKLDKRRVGRQTKKIDADSLDSRLEALDRGERQEILGKCYALQAEVGAVKMMRAKVEELDQVYRELLNRTNPCAAECSALESVLLTLQQTFEQKRGLHDEAQVQFGFLKELDAAFGHTGVQVSEELVSRYIVEISSSVRRFLSAVSCSLSLKVSAGSLLFLIISFCVELYPHSCAIN